MKNPIIASMLILLFIIFTIPLTGCEKVDPSVKAVKNSMTEVSSSGRNFQIGDLEGGIAVLVDDWAAYWVSNNTVYAANGFAKQWSPNVSYAPSRKVDFSSVKASVQ